MRASRISALYDTESHPKSLTPQRKHRKLLKDGSSEVWPEDIERIFVQGLREYWESPWATYSRGRSRWRNQFLVDYLHKNGVDRSKKQVASHIQVLRNMWKGEPEYHLVAGGEELFLETTLLPSVKAEDSPDAHLLTPAGLFDDHSPASDRSAGSATSPCPPHSLCTGSSPTVASTVELTLPHSHGVPSSRADDDGRRIRSLSAPDSHRTDPRRLSPLSSYWTCDLARPPATRSPPSGPYTAIDQSFDFAPHYSPEPSHQHNLSDSPLLFTESSLFSADPSPSPIGLTRLSLWAEGMPTLSLPVDALISSTQPFGQPFQAVLRIKLLLPPIDVPVFPALHGFQGSITCTMRPSATVRCSTAIFVRGQCTSRESNICTLMNADSSRNDHLESVTLLLPDSPLSRSRWLDSTSPTCIVQKIIVNDQVLAVIFYDLDRGQCETMPTAKLVGIQKYHARPERTPSPQSAYHTDSLLPTYTHMPGQCIPRSSLPNHTSLSYALSAINADTSLSGTSSYSTAFMMPSLLS